MNPLYLILIFVAVDAHSQTYVKHGLSAIKILSALEGGIDKKVHPHYSESQRNRAPQRSGVEWKGPSGCEARIRSESSTYYSNAGDNPFYPSVNKGSFEAVVESPGKPSVRFSFDPRDKSKIRVDDQNPNSVSAVKTESGTEKGSLNIIRRAGIPIAFEIISAKGESARCELYSPDELKIIDLANSAELQAAQARPAIEALRRVLGQGAFEAEMESSDGKSCLLNFEHIARALNGKILPGIRVNLGNEKTDSLSWLQLREPSSEDHFSSWYQVTEFKESASDVLLKIRVHSNLQNFEPRWPLRELRIKKNPATGKANEITFMSETEGPSRRYTPTSVNYVCKGVRALKPLKATALLMKPNGKIEAVEEVVHEEEVSGELLSPLHETEN